MKTPSLVELEGAGYLVLGAVALYLIYQAVTKLGVPIASSVKDATEGAAEGAAQLYLDVTGEHPAISNPNVVNENSPPWKVMGLGGSGAYVPGTQPQAGQQGLQNFSGVNPTTPDYSVNK